jgi:acylphosphatase
MHAIITGRVQGVNFRAFTRRQAVALGLTGWARNRPDGTVEVLAEGERGALEALAARVQDGPPMAHVTGILTEFCDGTGEFAEFVIRY